MANKAGVYAIEVEPAALKNLIRTLNMLPKDFQNEIRDAAQPMSQRLAGQLMMSAMAAPSPQARLLANAKAIKTPRDRLIRVDVGGSTKVGRKYGGVKNSRGTLTKQNSAPAGALLWGTEYGSHEGVDSLGRRYTNRFKVAKSRRGYWIAPAVDYYTPIVAKEYIDMVQSVIKKERLD